MEGRASCKARAHSPDVPACNEKSWHLLFNLSPSRCDVLVCLSILFWLQTSSGAARPWRDSTLLLTGGAQLEAGGSYPVSIDDFSHRQKWPLAFSITPITIELITGKLPLPVLCRYLLQKLLKCPLHRVTNLGG